MPVWVLIFCIFSWNENQQNDRQHNMEHIDSFKRKPKQKSQDKHKATSEPYFFDNFSHFCQDMNIFINQKNDSYSQKYRVVNILLHTILVNEDDHKICHEHE